MFQAQDPDFRERVRASFARQQVMATLGIEMIHLEPGEIHLSMPPNPAFTQQHGFMPASSRPRSTAPAAMPRSA